MSENPGPEQTHVFGVDLGTLPGRADVVRVSDGAAFDSAGRRGLLA